MEINRTIQFPSIMAGKKILYVHGFGSSGQSGTVAKIREMLPAAEVIAPDLPVHPAEALEMLHHTCEEVKPDLIIGTSMGGMYAEQLTGFDRILVNPAFQMGDTMLKHGMVGKNTFLNPRQDGVQEFIVTKAMVEEYREATELCFSHCDDEGEQDRVFGLFGDEDPVVHTFDLFASKYRNAISFHGEHRMNDKILLHSVVPVVQWIDDRQEGRERPIIYVTLDTLRDEHGNQRSSAVKAFRTLFENYTPFITARLTDTDSSYVGDVLSWVQDVINVPAWGHVVLTDRRDLIYGDYLIDSTTECRSKDFMGTRIDFGSDSMKTWEEVIEFFSRLGGQ